jgi:hypothetical protein
LNFIDKRQNAELISYLQLILLDCNEGEDEIPFKIHRRLLRRRHVRKEQKLRYKRRREEQARQQADEQDEKERRNQQITTAELGCDTDKMANKNVSSPSLQQKEPLFSAVQIYGSQSSLVSLYNSPTCDRVPTFSPLRPSKRRNTREVSPFH